MGTWKERAKGGLLALFAIFILMGAYSPGSTIDNDDGSFASGQNNIALTMNLPYSFDGTNFTRAGCTSNQLISGASTNATSVKASAGIVYAIYATNSNAAFRYLKLYNKASAPTVGTDTPQNVFGLPATGGGTIGIPQTGINFATGVALATTTGAANSDTGAVAANEILVMLCYK